MDALIKAADNLVDTISGLMPQNGITNSWKSTKYKPRKQHANRELKECSTSKRKLKGWRNNSWQRVKKQAHSTARHHSLILK